MMTTDEKIENHEVRITKLEVSDARLDEKLSNLATSTDRLLKVCVIFGLILLGTVCYMALGERGYKNVVGRPLLPEAAPTEQCD